MPRILLIGLILLSLKAHAQAPTLFNAGLLHISDSAEVHVFGNVVIDGSNAILEHKGFLQTYADANPGNFELQNQGNVFSSGNFKIQNDWINNGYLQIDSGLVEMYGDNQWFLGDSISNFWKLWLTGTGIKEQGQQIRVRSELDINNLELAVHDQIVHIDNSSPTSILFDPGFGQEGIISTDEDGQIRKVVVLNESNLIPTGSSQGSFRHRPLKTTLLSGAGQDTVFATFHQHSPTLAGASESDMDTSLCKIQTLYFYTVNAAGPGNHYQLDFAHYPPQDGYYPDLAQWYSPTWKMVYDRSNYSDLNYSYVRATDEFDFTLEHYTLGYQTPHVPYMLFDSTECYSDATYQVETPLGQPWYQWTVLNSDYSAEIEAGQGTDIATVNWNDNIGGWVYVQYQDTAGCWSHTDSAEVIDVHIDAQFTYAHDYTNDLSTYYQFYNQSSANTEEIQWTIEGNSADWISAPYLQMAYPHTFTTNGEETDFEVMLIAHDLDYGCYDTMIQVVTVPKAFVFYCPNTFTPDGDGFNQTFFAQASDVEFAQMTIYNRWGEIIYDASSNLMEDLVWDGTYRGQQVPSGTYTYHFILYPVNYNAGELGALEYQGHVSLLR